MEQVRSAHYFTPSTVLTGTKRVEHDSRLEIYLVVEMAMKGGFGVSEIRSLSRHEVGSKMCVRKIAPCVSTSLHVVSGLLRLLISISFCSKKKHYILNEYSTGTLNKSKNLIWFLSWKDLLLKIGIVWCRLWDISFISCILARISWICLLQITTNATVLVY